MWGYVFPSVAGPIKLLNKTKQCRCGATKFDDACPGLHMFNSTLHVFVVCNAYATALANFSQDLKSQRRCLSFPNNFNSAGDYPERPRFFVCGVFVCSNLLNCNHTNATWENESDHQTMIILEHLSKQMLRQHGLMVL